MLASHLPGPVKSVMTMCDSACLRDVIGVMQDGMSGSDVGSGSDDEGEGEEGGSSEEYGAGEGDSEDADAKYAAEMET